MTFRLKLHGKKKGALNKSLIKYKSLPISTDRRDFIELKTFGEKGILPNFLKNGIGLFIDPGSKNFSLCVIKNNKVLGTQMLKNPLKEIKSATFSKIINDFSYEISSIINTVKPSVIVIERWVVRGFGSGSADLIAKMDGMIIEMCRWKGIYYHSIMSGQWKMKTKAFFDNVHCVISL